MTKKVNKIAEKTTNRKQLAGRKRDQHLQQILIWSAAALGGIILLILGVGAVQEFLIKPNQVVATVGETEIKAGAFRSRVRYQRLLLRSQLIQYDNFLAELDPTDPNSEAIRQQIQQARASLQNQLTPELKNLLGGDVLDMMIEEELVRQEALRQDLTVSNEEITRQIEQFMGYDRDATLDASESLTETEALPNTVTEARFQENYDAFKSGFLREAGLSEADFRQMIEADLLRTRLQETFTTEVEAEAEQALVSFIVTDTEEAAEALRERFIAGEDFESLIEELNANEEPLNGGGSLPWYRAEDLISTLGPEMGTLAFELPVGEVSEPIADPDGFYYVIHVAGREVRPVDDFLLEQEAEQLYEVWLSEQMEEKVEYFDWESVTPATP